MMAFLFKVWLASMLFTILMVLIEDALKYRGRIYMWVISIVVLGLDIGLLFVMGIMMIWGIE